MGLGDEFNQIVTFNVGGTHYEVSRSLISQFPDTMLARLSSETWRRQSNHGEEKPLFIERNGERFQYCLDYMRDGGVVDLPATVSKAALLRDLEYYGFYDVDPSAISEPLSSYEERFRDYKQLWRDGIIDEDLKMLANACGDWRLRSEMRNPLLVSYKEKEGFITFTLYRKPRRMGYTGHNKLRDTAERLVKKSSKHEWYVSRFNEHLKPRGLKFREHKNISDEYFSSVEIRLEGLYS